MQGLVDIVESVTGNMRRVIGMLVLAGLVVSGILMLGVHFTAPMVAEEVSNRAERFGERALQAAIEERRDEELAEHGWGYSAADNGAQADLRGSEARDPKGEQVGGWGSE